MILSTIVLLSTSLMAMNTRDYYNKNCATCHGKNAGKAPIAVQTEGTEYTKGKPMKNKILKGKSALELSYAILRYRDHKIHAVGNDGLMHSEVSKFSDEQIVKMVGYIRSIGSKF